MPTLFLGDIDLTTLHFSPLVVDKKVGKKSVDVTVGSSVVNYANRLSFQMCADENHPLVARWNLSTPRDDDRDKTRRTYELRLEEDSVLMNSLKQLDAIVLKKAQENAREWWKKDLSPEAVAAKFKPIVGEPRLMQDGVTPDAHTVKIKVVCPPAERCSTIMRIDRPGVLVPGAPEDLTRDAEVIPIVRTMGIWFLGDSQFGMSLMSDKLIVKPVRQPSFLESFSLSSKYVIVDGDDAAAAADESSLVVPEGDDQYHAM